MPLPKPSRYSYHEAIALIGKRLYPGEWDGSELKAGGYIPPAAQKFGVTKASSSMPSPVDENGNSKPEFSRWLGATEYLMSLMNDGYVKTWIKLTDGSIRLIYAGILDWPENIKIDFRLGTATVLPPYNSATYFVIFYEDVEVLGWQGSDIPMRMY